MTEHERLMWEAIRQAEEARQAGERPIGAVIACDGEIVGRGRARHRERNRKTAHAEMNALEDAGAFLSDNRHRCTIYSTLEPCVMCLGAIVMSDIDHIVFGMSDHWIEPSGALSIPYMRRNVKTYLGGVLVDPCQSLWSDRPDEASMLLLGARKTD